MFTDISKFCTPHSVAWVLSCATHTQHARNMACCAATQRGNLRCFALLPRIFGTASLLNGVLPFLRPVSGRSAKHRKLQRCVAAQHAMLRACCVCVAHDKTHATLQIVDKLLPHSKWPAKPPNYCEFHRQPKNRAKKSKRSVDNFFTCRETSKASPSTKYRPTPDREAFNHKTLRLQIQPARHPRMRPQHHVQPLTNPPGHAQEPHKRYRCKTTDNNKTYCSNPPTACNWNYTRSRTDTK